MEYPLFTLVSTFAPYGITDDGFPEVLSCSFVLDEDRIPVKQDAPLVLVFVEERLVQNWVFTPADQQLFLSLRQYQQDLAVAGFTARFVSFKLYQGPIQKDGQILLCLRRFIQLVHDDYPNLKGLVLIGRFPDAAIVRRETWAPGFVNPRTLALQTGIMSERSDLLLGDIDGNWEEHYKKDDFWVDDIAALPDAATTARGWYDGEDVIDCEFTSASFQVNRVGPFRDVFFIDDAIYNMEQSQGTLRMQLFQKERNREVSGDDYRNKPNVIARPEIPVSRINAWHAAVNPSPTLSGSDGSRFLDQSKQPATVMNEQPLFSGRQEDALFTHHDAELEKELLVRYFKRNHDFRMGAWEGQPWRSAIISGTTDFNPNYYEQFVNNAATDFKPCHKVYDANLLQYVEFLKTPAVLKFIIAHSTNRCAWFNSNGYTNDQLQAAVGGTPYRWTYENNSYTPNFKTKDSAADMFVHRALWQYGLLEETGASLMIHGGCNVNSVAEVFSHRYTEHDYGHWHNAEGILFFTNCVALLARAKFFNDTPESFAGTFRNGEKVTFGDCWLNYFETEANAAHRAHMNVGRKRPYFWSICGDWSLRLRNRNGIGILNMQTGLQPQAILPDNSMIDGWDYTVNTNQIKGTGDIDGDGTDEILIRSAAGLGIAKLENGQFKLLHSVSPGTMAGAWLFNTTDILQATDHFISATAKEIMIWNDTGFAFLTWTQGKLSTIRNCPNGSQLGDWPINTIRDQFAGTGRFKANAAKDIILMNSSGLGILSPAELNHRCLIPNGTAIGAWVLNTAPGNDYIKLIADLDGDGLDEIIIGSPDKTGIFKFANDTLTPLAIYPNGTNVNGYIIHSSHTFIADHYLDTNSKSLLINDGNSFRFFWWYNGALRLRYNFPRGTRINGWLIEPALNTIEAIGNIHPDDNRAQFIIRSGWGIGIMGFSSINQFRCYAGYAYNTKLGNWYLHAGNKIHTIAKLTSGHPKKSLLLTGR